MENVFEHFAPFIQDYIFKKGWTELRPIQLDAAEVIFGSDDNLLLTSSTASGKTEAAFFPIISILSETKDEGFGALYIAPLKSLINDQFARLDELLDLSGIPVYHWHGDVTASHKTRALKEPRGILQITPESFESMLMNRPNDMPRLFGNLRFAVIDEVHALMGTDRGSQIMCQLARLMRAAGCSPRRVGLSATIGDPEFAADWLGSGSGRHTAVPPAPVENLRWRLGMEHFFIQNRKADQSEARDLSSKEEQKSGGGFAEVDLTASPEPGPGQSVPEEKEPDEAMFDAGYEFIYDCVRTKKSIVFSNSREETEHITATLRQIAEKRREPDRFLIHHGNLSAALREEAELKLKDDDVFAVVCATVTLELGIDIGRLQRVVQNDAPNTVSSLLQRLGRSGRRGDPPEMMMVFREEDPLPNTPLPQMMPWGLLRAIAIVQLYLEERFIEPPRIKNLPFSLLFQQTLSTLASCGELEPAKLAGRVLTLPPFVNVPKEDYKELLRSMLENDYIERTDEGGLIVGIKGERLISSFKFYAVFKDSEDYTVRCESAEIGTITTPPPVGDRFALAGKVWEVEELDLRRRLLYVKQVKGKMEISWPGDFGEIHTRILERMKQVLAEDTVYPYLKGNARARLAAARDMARNTGMLEHSLVPLGNYSYCLFPWLGTRSFRTLRKFLARQGAPFKLHSIEFEGCYYITFKMENGTADELIRALADAAKAGINTEELVGRSEAPIFEKYDAEIPAELLRHAYCADKLRVDEVERRLAEMAKETEI